MRKLLIYILFLVSISAQAQSQIVIDFAPACDSLATLIQERTGVAGELKLKSITRRNTTLDFYFTESLGDFPWKDGGPKWFKSALHRLFPENYKKYKVGEIHSRGVLLEHLVTPQLAADGHARQTRHRAHSSGNATAIVTELNTERYDKGLRGRHIALWQSHGRYYSHNLDRWAWQRPCLFQTCEDMFTQSFVLPYLVPMLENAGAYVMMPRERDIQVNEVIVDNDSSWISEPVIDVAGWKGAVRGIGTYAEEGTWTKAGDGFADLKEIYTETDNPFKLGSSRMTQCIPANRKSDYASIIWRPQIPSRGEYAVYVSYKSLPNSSTSANYTVHHLGGESSFAVNQKMGGGTWIYLGTFEFDEGSNGYVTLDNRTPEGWKHYSGSVVTADAVRFGGGIGNIARGEEEPCVSGMPRSAEAARYWLQWAGTDTSVWYLNEGLNDYRDDFMSRGDWVEWISRGSWMNPKKEGGVGVPVDLTLGFHSDAGVTPNDSLVGTLAIYTLKSEKTKMLPSGESRLTSRDYAASVQDQIVHDMRHEFDSLWSQRSIWDRGYRESRTPSSPALLLELLSHQNFTDMKYGLDPAFRFAVSRSVYKGMLKYMSNRYGKSYAVQPLPVDNMGVRFLSENTAQLSWRPVMDPLEPTAKPEGYILYTRIDDGAFDKGRKITHPSQNGQGVVSIEVPVIPGKIVSYKIAAYNDGGLSFPSEIVSIGRPAEGTPAECNSAEGTPAVGNSAEGNNEGAVLIVNNFDRISGPAFFDTPTYAGFNNRIDSGVPYIKDIAYVGQQFNNIRGEEWIDDERPGFGASDQDYAAKVVAGNTFDYAYIHGQALMNAGHAFFSCSNEAFCSDSTFRVNAWAVDLVCGKQVTTTVGSGMRQEFSVFTPMLQTALKQFAENGGNILVSGSYIGTDLSGNIFPIQKDSIFMENSIKFAADVLGYRWRTGQASRTGQVKAVRNELVQFTDLGTVSFYNEVNPVCYSVESPDGIIPESESAKTVLRYSDTGVSAGVGYEGAGYRTVCIGFPIETLQNKEDINKIINITLDYFKK